MIADGAGSVEIYYDNASLGTTAIATTFDITSVAQAFNQTTQSMNGQIDELYIYNEAIDDATINALFTGIPEPTALGMAGLGCLMLLRRRRPDRH